MMYFILLVLGAYLVAMGTRANVLNLEIKDSALAHTDRQVSVWHELGGFNTLFLQFGPATVMSFLAGIGVLAAYIGLWQCALGALSGLVMVILGAGVCGLVQYTMLDKIKKYFSEYEKTVGENPQQYFTGKNGIPHAVYTSVMVGVGKMVKFVLICSVVGILLYVFLRQTALKVIDLETAVITGDFEFPPRTIYDENENAWVCTDVLGEDQNIRVYTPVTAQNGREAAMKIYVDVNKAMEKPNATRMTVGNREFHW